LNTVRKGTPVVATLYPLAVRIRNVKKKKTGSSSESTEDADAGSGRIKNGRKKRRRGDCNEFVFNEPLVQGSSQLVKEATGKQEGEGAANKESAEGKGAAVDRKPVTGGEKVMSKDWTIPSPTPSLTLLLEPFPTTFWLLDPLLIRAISVVEDIHNGVKTLEKRLAGDEQAQEEMAMAHKAYADTRLSLLSDSDLEAVTQRKWIGGLGVSRGVGGIGNFKMVKCLHTHTAHFLSGPGGKRNTLGRWTMELIQQHGLLEGEAAAYYSASAEATA
jgi:hypothetical protein